MPNLFNKEFLLCEIRESIAPEFTLTEESKIKGNTDGIRVFPQNIIELYTLLFIYSAFVKNKIFAKLGKRKQW